MQYPDFSKARVGDRVWDLTEGWGVIVDTDAHPGFPIRVRYLDDSYEFYTKNGFFSRTNIRPKLYWSEWHPTPPPEAITPPKRTRKETRWFFISWHSVHNEFKASSLYETKADAEFYMHELDSFLSSILASRHEFTYIYGPFSVTFEVPDE